MKKTIILFLICTASIFSQSLSVFDVDPSAFPTINAKFYALDVDGKQILNLSRSDFEVTEDGVKRNVTNVSCPSPGTPESISAVLVMDVSSSMSGPRLALAKQAANAWIDGMTGGKSECAITSFSDINYFIQDFTTDKQKLKTAVNKLYTYEGTNYNAALIDKTAGGILVAKNGKYKKVIVFLTDGQPNFTPDEKRIISEAKNNDIAIYCVSVNMPMPQCMKNFASQTGGQYFADVTTTAQVREIYQKILKTVQKEEPCSIEWESGTICTSTMINADIKLLTIGTLSKIAYQPPDNGLPKLEFTPSSVKFINPELGIKKDTTIIVTAWNGSFNISSITSSNAAYMITPTSLSLNAGESKSLKVSYIPADSGYTFTKFNIENDLCFAQYNASGGYPGKIPTVNTLKLIHPNGGQVFVVGMDTIITWEGVLPEDKVIIEYTTDNGSKWIKIADSAKDLSYRWQIPKTPSNQCLARVTTKSSFSGCDNPDVQIGNQIWMGCNLNIDTYCNGVPIRHAETKADWVDAGNKSEGAWCYIESDSIFCEICGKLYNWYAINSPNGLAPDGWHIPTDAEWSELENYLGGSSVAGGKLKSPGTIEGGTGFWINPNTGATNESGFSALPCNWYNDDSGIVYSFGHLGSWWSSTELDKAKAFSRSVWYDSGGILKLNSRKESGFSVRCVRLVGSILPSSTKLQTDQSDAVWSIVMPVAESQDVDMKQCLVGGVRDSVVAGFIWNSGSYLFRVDSIYFRGADAPSFSLVSGFPQYIIDPGMSKEAEFRFIPQRIGLHQAEIVIITQADTLVQTIQGEGIQPQLEVIGSIIDFGQVDVGKQKDTLQVVTIKNTGTAPLDILNTKHNYPNDKDFSTLAGGGNFSLQPKETKNMDFRFKPSDAGRTSGTLEFHYNGIGSPAVVQLYGEGIKTKPGIQSNFVTLLDLVCDNISTSELTLSNPGDDTLIITEMNLIGTNSSDFYINEPLPIRIEPDSSKKIAVSFIPKSIGAKSADLEIKSNADPDSLITIAIKATKDSIDLFPEVSVIELGLLCPNETKDSTFIITNKGTLKTGAFTSSSSLINTSKEFIIDSADFGTIQLSYLGQTNEGKINEKITITDSICGRQKDVLITGDIVLPKVKIDNISINAVVGTSVEGILTLKNESVRQCTLNSSTTVLLPFAIVGNTFPLTIPGNGQAEIKVTYTPDDTLSDKLTLIFDGMPCSINSQAEVTGLPVTVSVTLQTPDFEAYPGEIIDVPVILKNEQNLAMSGVKEFEVNLNFNTTLLIPLNYPVQSTGTNAGFITLTDLPSDIISGATLTSIKFKAGLGDATESKLLLTDAKAIGGIADVGVESGTFRLLGICPEGGNRLINPTGNTQILSIKPNPSSESVDIEVELIETGNNKLYITNILGNEVKHIFTGSISYIGIRMISTDISELPAGMYFVVFQTPTIRQSVVMIKK